MKDTIERQAAIDALGEEPKVWSKYDDYALGERSQWRIDKLAIESVPSAQPEQRWIPCNEKPDTDRDVFIARGSHDFMTVCIGHYDHDLELWYEDRNFFAKLLYDGLYWCEIPSLPEAYKGDEK